MLSRPGWGWRRNSFQSACQSNTLELPPLAPEEWLVLKSSIWHSFWKSDVFFFLKKRKQWQTWEVVPGAFFWSTQAGGSKKEPFGPVPASIHMVGTVLWTSGPVPARPAGKTPTRFLAVFSSAMMVTLKSGCIDGKDCLCALTKLAGWTESNFERERYQNRNWYQRCSCFGQRQRVTKEDDIGLFFDKESPKTLNLWDIGTFYCCETFLKDEELESVYMSQDFEPVTYQHWGEVTGEMELWGGKLVVVENAGASAQRVPKPDPLPSISFDTQPDPIQF